MKLAVPLAAALAGIALIGYGLLLGIDTLTATQGDDEPLIGAAVCVIAGLGVFGWLADRYEV